MKSILVTAGPTREKIDPIRFISNYSTGTFGYAIAKEARRRGHRVCLISGPTGLAAPGGVKLIRVESALEMRQALKREFGRHDCLIMAAAVCDWRVKRTAKNKIKREGGGMRLDLVANPDMLCELGREKKRNKLLVGFALETGDLAKNAAKKLKRKNLDLIIANKLSGPIDVFGDKYTDILMIDRAGNKAMYRQRSKAELAKIILDKVSRLKI